MVTAESRAAVRRAYYARNRDRINEVRRLWRKNNHDRCTAQQRRYFRKRVARDPAFRIKKNISRRIRHALRGASKQSNTCNILGCTAEQLRIHLESQFLPDMSWGNYGTVWNIDHRTPCAYFDHRDWEQVKRCHHYTNLQPMYKTDNEDKSSWFEGKLWTSADHEDGPEAVLHSAVQHAGPVPARDEVGRARSGAGAQR